MTMMFSEHPLKSVGTTPVDAQTIFQDLGQAVPVLVSNERKKEKKKKEKLVIDSVESFITFSIKQKKVVFNDHLFRAIKDQSHLQDDVRVQLLEQLTMQDHSLDLSRQLMIAALNAYSYPRVTEMLREFAKRAICSHPVFTHSSENDIFPHSSENIVKFVGLCSRLTRLLDDKYRIIKTFQKEKDKKGKKESDSSTEKNESETLKIEIKAIKNTIFASAAWRILCRIESSDQILAGLQQTFFSYKPEARQRDIDLTSMLCTGTPDNSGFNALISYQSSMYEQEKQKSTNYSVKLNRTEAMLESKQAALDETLIKNKELLSSISCLQQEVTSLKEQRNVDLVHFNDEKEQQRAHTLKKLENDVLLIAESLVALTREPPKISVAQNYMGSVNESLLKEISYLKEQK